MKRHDMTGGINTIRKPSLAGSPPAVMGTGARPSPRKRRRSTFFHSPIEWVALWLGRKIRDSAIVRADLGQRLATWATARLAMKAIERSLRL